LFVCLCVRSVAYGVITRKQKWRKNNEIGANVPMLDRSNRCADMKIATTRNLS